MKGASAAVAVPPPPRAVPAHCRARALALTVTNVDEERGEPGEEGPSLRDGTVRGEERGGGGATGRAAWPAVALHPEPGQAA